MTERERILELLKDHPEGLDDDVIAQRLGFGQRQQANSRCRDLQREGLLERRSIAGKIRNILAGSAKSARSEVETVPAAFVGESAKPWCWEGNVVTALTTFFTNRGWMIEAVAKTETGEPGADIRARRSDRILVVEAKGYPSRVYERGSKKGQPKRTAPATQARHWVAEALLVALLRQSEDSEHHVAIAFPEFQVYTKLLSRIVRALKQLNLIVLLVQESGALVVVHDERQIIEGSREV
jgi:hypothetical protein